MSNGNVDQEKPQSVSPMKSDVLSAIDAEINYILNEQKNTGWTHQILIATLGTVLWFLTNQLSEFKFDLKNVFFILGVLLFFYFPFRVLAKYLEGSKDSSGKEMRFYFIKGEKLRILTDIFIFLFIIWAFKTTQSILWHFYGQVGSDVLFRSLIGWVAILLLLYLFILVCAFTDLALSNGPSTFEEVKEKPAKKKSFIFWGIYFLMGFFLAIVLLRLVLINLVVYKVFSFDDFQIAGMLFSIYVIFQILMSGNNSEILIALKKVKRNLAFGKVTPEDAMEQVDITVAGMPLSNLLKREVKFLVDEINLVDYFLGEAQKAISFLKYSLSKAPGENPISEETLIKPVSDIEVYFSSAKKSFEKCLKANGTFHIRARFYSGMVDAAYPDIFNLQQKVYMSLENLIKRQDLLREQLKSDSESLKAAVGSSHAGLIERISEIRLV